MRPQDGSSLSRLGYQVTISGDIAAVSSIYINSSRGAVYIYSRNNSIWSFEQKLTAADAVNNSFFGSGIEISGNTIAVGAGALSS